MAAITSRQAIATVREAEHYLRSCGIRLPQFEVTAKRDEDRKIPVGGSYVMHEGKETLLNMGRYPTTFLARWFAIHELGHVLWLGHRPLRWPGFRKLFGEPEPENYETIYSRESYKTVMFGTLSWHCGPQRPRGEPSWYGKLAGGEERFCELLALMYANADFATPPPADLEDLWNGCWTHGLSRMV